MVNQTKTWTINSILNWTTQYLGQLGVEWPHLEGEILLAHALQVKRIELYIQHERILTEAELAKYKALILRRSKREPVAYLVGTQPFMSLEFDINPAVLIPRPETEKLVEIVLDLAKEITSSPQFLKDLPSTTSTKNPQNPILKIADLCTGSGAIAVTLAKYLPQAIITATDISEEALAVARRNAEKFEVLDRINFIKDDLLDSQLPASLDPQRSSELTFDILVSNPPYIPTKALPKLMPDVQNFEPVAALDGGSDGLTYIRQLIQIAPRYLSDGGYLVMEIGSDQKESVLKLCQAEGSENHINATNYFREIRVVRDQFDKDRVFIEKISHRKD